MSLLNTCLRTGRVYKVNFLRGKLRTSNESGIILIVVLWMLVILSFMAIGLGMRARMELALTKHGIGKLKSKYSALSGFHYAMAAIKGDSDDEEAATLDTKYQCGFALKEGDTPEQLFNDRQVGEGIFRIYYPLLQGDQGSVLHYGLTDEESRLNINTLTPSNYGILSRLMMLLGYEEEIAETVASSVIDWRDEASDIFNEPYGAESDHYLGLDSPYDCKNGAFESPEEIMLVRAMTPEIFSQLKGLITVYPPDGPFLINFETAVRDVLHAFALSLTGSKTNTTVDDAEALIDKMITYRNGSDGLHATEDDKVIDINQMGLNAKEKVIFLLMARNRTKISNYLRVGVQGLDGPGGIFTEIEAVIERKNLSVVYWRRRK